MPPPRSISPAEARRLRVRAQRLDRRSGDPHEVAAALCAVQAQYPRDPGLALRARVEGLTAAGVEEARTRARTLVRTWCQRGTLHLLPAADLGWQRALFAPAAAPAEHRWLDKRGLDAAARSRAVRALHEVLLAEGPLARGELLARVGRATGLEVGHAGLGLVALAALEGLICFGPDQGSQPTYVALDRWLPSPPPLETAEPVERYLAGHGPAGPEDFARWSGLPVGQARALWRAAEDRLVEVTVDGAPAWLTGTEQVREEPKGPVVRLLGGFDPYLLGWAARDAVAQEDQRHLYQAGLIRPAVLVNGRAAGTWRLRGTQVRVLPFAPLATEIAAGLEEEAADLGRYLGVATDLVVLRPGDGADNL